MKKRDRSREELEIEKLRAELAETKETLLAIRSGEVDALVVSTPQGDQIFTLKGAEHPYRILMEKMKEGAVTLTGYDTIFYCNQGFADMLKRPLEKMIGTGISRFVSPSDKLVFEKLLRHGNAGSSKGEVTFLAEDGTAVPTYLSINTMLLNELSTVYLVATDITERKQAEAALQKAHDELEIKVQERTAELVTVNEELHAEITERELVEEALRESEQRWATTLASIGDAVIATDVESRITFMNAVAEELTGWALVEASTRPVAEVFNIINERTRQAVENPFARVLSQGIVIGLANHTILVRRDGTEVPIDDSGAPIKDGDGRTMGVVLIFRDITERKWAEEALRKAHDELEIRVRERTEELEEANVELEAEIAERERAEQAAREAHKYAENIVETLRESLVVLDAQLRVKIANQTFYNTFKIAPEETEGKLLYELGNHQWDIPELRELLDEIIPKNMQFYDFEVDQDFSNIGRKTMRLNARLLYQEKSGTQLILLAIEDITEKKRLESQLLRSQRMESIGTLAGGIAHDLNNLLTPMMMSLSMLKQKYKDEQSQKLLTVLENNSQRGANLIKQVMSFARGIEGERKPLQVAHIIAEIEKIAKETFPRGIELRTDIPKDLFTISGDATQLHQVIMNLCVNARDAMPYGGTLSITASNYFIDKNYEQMHAEAKVGPYVIITVSDTGTGIPPKIVDRIFEPFFTTKEFGKGTGLGLSTALAIVKSHGGFITVYSEVGKGTTFRVHLPAAKTEVQKEGEEQLKLSIGHGELILVAEDEGSIREITSSTLEAYGYKVLTADDGAAAVALYAQNKDKIKVVLMDLMMPVMDGHTSIRAIRRINPEVKIIAASGLAEKEKLKDVADNTNAFLPKPYTAERLLKTINEVLSAK
jgi:PAS domain S-box-containing protein